MSRTSIIVLLFISASFSDLFFKVVEAEDNIYAELKKDKHADKDRGEDSSKTTPYMLVVADGIGGCKFSSRFISELLTVRVAREFVKNGAKNTKLSHPISEFRRMILSFIIDEIKTLDKIYSTSWALNVDQWANGRAILPYEKYTISTTMIITFIENGQANKPVLKVFQKGDSGIAIFRKKPSAKLGTFHYELFFLSSEQQSKFNCPYQFVSDPTHKINTNLDAAYELEIHEDDIVIQGSDGLFDNLHVTVLNFMVNYLVLLYQTSDYKKVFKTKVFDYLVEGLFRKFLKSKDRTETRLNELRAALDAIRAEIVAKRNKEQKSADLEKPKKPKNLGPAPTVEQMPNETDSNQEAALSPLELNDLLDDPTGNSEKTKGGIKPEFFDRLYQNPKEREEHQNERKKAVEEAGTVAQLIRKKSKTEDLANEMLVKSLVDDLTPTPENKLIELVQRNANKGKTFKEMTENIEESDGGQQRQRRMDFQSEVYTPPEESKANSLLLKATEGLIKKVMQEKNGFEQGSKKGPEDVVELFDQNGVIKERNTPSSKIESKPQQIQYNPVMENLYGRGPQVQNTPNSKPQYNPQQLQYNPAMEKLYGRAPQPQKNNFFEEGPGSQQISGRKVVEPLITFKKNWNLERLLAKQNPLSIEGQHLNFGKNGNPTQKKTEPLSFKGPVQNMKPANQAFIQQKPSEGKLKKVEKHIDETKNLAENQRQNALNKDGPLKNNFVEKKGLIRPPQNLAPDVAEELQRNQYKKPSELLQNQQKRGPSEVFADQRKRGPSEQPQPADLGKQKLEQFFEQKLQQHRPQSATNQFDSSHPIFTEVLEKFFTISSLSLLGIVNLPHPEKHRKDPKITDQTIDEDLKRLMGDYFQFNTYQMNSFKSRFNANQFAFPIAAAVKQIAVTDTYYPSVFYVRSYLDSPEPTYPAAKDDDITVVVGLVLDDRSFKSEYETSREEEYLKFLQAEYVKSLPIAVQNFVNYMMTQAKATKLQKVDSLKVNRDVSNKNKLFV